MNASASQTLSPAEEKRLIELLGRSPTPEELTLIQFMWDPKVSRISIWNELQRLPPSENPTRVLQGPRRLEMSGGRLLVAELSTLSEKNSSRFTSLDTAGAKKLIQQVILPENDTLTLGQNFRSQRIWKIPAAVGPIPATRQLVGLVPDSDSLQARLLAPDEVVVLIGPDPLHQWSEMPGALEAKWSQKLRRFLADDHLLDVVRGARILNRTSLLPALCTTTGGSDLGLHINLEFWPFTLRDAGWQAVLLEKQVSGLFVFLQADLEPDLRSLLVKHGLIGMRIANATPDGNFSLLSSAAATATIPIKLLLPGGGLMIPEMVEQPHRKFKKAPAIDWNALPEPENWKNSLQAVLTSPRVRPFPLVLRAADNPPRILDLPLVLRHRLAAGQTLISALAGYPVIMALNPKRGAAMAVASASRKVVCTGASVRALTVSFVTPDLSDKEHFHYFQEAVKGVAEAAEVLNLPVISRAVQAGPQLSVMVGAIGQTPSGQRIMLNRFKDDGDFIVMLGTLKGELSGSVYLETVLSMIGSEPPELDMVFEDRVQRAAREAIQDGIVKSVTTIDAGGLVAALARACLADSDNPHGCELYIHRKFRNDQLLFGESQSVIIVTLNEKHLLDLEKITQVNQVPSATIGRVRGDRFIVNEDIDLGLDDLGAALNWPPQYTGDGK